MCVRQPTAGAAAAAPACLPCTCQQCALPPHGRTPCSALAACRSSLHTCRLSNHTSRQPSLWGDDLKPVGGSGSKVASGGCCVIS